jgi:hypothetical protein
MKRVLPWLVGVARRAAVTIDFFPALAALVSPVRYNFPQRTLFHYFPSPSNLGRQACWVACLLICISELACQGREGGGGAYVICMVVKQ